MMDNNKSRFWYFIFVIVGFIMTVALINYLTKGSRSETVETFEVPGPPALDIPLDDIITDIPRKSALSLYLTAFSEPATFQCETNYWCDATNPNTKFFLLSDTTLPARLTPASGLPLNGVKLRGPSAYTLAPEAPHLLDSFTLVFYAKINSLSVLDQPNADGSDKTIILWELPAETPHTVRLFIRPKKNAGNTIDTSMATIACSFGSDCDATTTKTWDFNRSTLIGTGNTPTLFALVFNKVDKDLKFYAGISATPTSIPIGASVPEIHLGISEIVINRQINWDANLVAMAYYHAALPADDLTTLDRYFMQHSTGLSKEVRVRETLESQIQDLMSRLNTGEDTIRELLDKLNAANQSCSTDASKQAMVEKLRRWQIKMQGNADISTDTELDKCKALDVKPFGANATSRTNAASSGTGSRRFNIPYPSEVTASTPSSSIDPPQSNNTPPRAPVDTNDSNGFWQSFFDFLKNQQEKTAQTEEKVDLNRAYDQLRDEVSTDKTQPGPGANLVASVQDPPRQEPVVSKTNTSGFWQTIKSIFADL